MHDPGDQPLGANDAKPGTIADRYRLLEVLGSGAMGVVYEARDDRLGRRVALKILRPDRVEPGNAADWEPRLLREAQSLAQLSHPHVVAVYDAGHVEGRIYLAMELVSGATAAEWAKEKPRAWREILNLYLQAGEGLAAAHAAGLVHRDFKPGNVLVGRDGTVKVADFGLARPLSEESPEESPARLPSLPGLPRITTQGALLGTPAYMAPEQLRGEDADARTDQFGFCLVLYEALYGERPFSGDDAESVLAATTEGRVRDAPAGTAVPAGLRRVLLRGLEAHRDARWPSMVELLDQLAPYRARPRRRWAWAVVPIAFAAALAVGVPLLGTRRTAVCKGAQGKLSGVWDAGRRRQIESSFLRVGRPFAADVWKRTRRRLDAYASRWVAIHREACEATRVLGTQSEDLLDHRMWCLRGRLQELRALSDLLRRASAATLDRAVQAAAALPGLHPCLRPSQRLAPNALPGTKRRADRDELRSALARVSALVRLGQYREAISAAERTATQARARGDPESLAESLMLLGQALQKSRRFPLAVKALSEASATALGSGDDRLAVQTQATLAIVLAGFQGKADEGERWAIMAAAGAQRLPRDALVNGMAEHALGTVRWAQGRHGEATRHLHRALDALRRAPERDPEIRGEILSLLGVVLSFNGRYQEALQVQRSVVQFQERLLGSDHPSVLTARREMGSVLLRMGRFREAERVQREAVRLAERRTGPEDALVAVHVDQLGVILWRLDRFREAVPLHRRALRIRRKTLGVLHPATAVTEGNLAAALREMGQLEDAVAHGRSAVQILTRTYGRDHPRVTVKLGNLGAILASADRAREALPILNRVLRIRETARGPNHPILGLPLTYLAVAHRKMGRVDLALPLLERALRIREKAYGPNHWRVGHSLLELAEARLDGRAPRQARRLLDRVLGLWRQAGRDNRHTAWARFLLARALWDGGGDRRRARSLARRAAAYLEKTGLRPRRLAAIRAWFRRQRK